MNKIKQLILIILLAIPVAIYLFLQAFGENEFNIPVYYENGLVEPQGGCLQQNSDQLYLASSLADMGYVSDQNETNHVVIYDPGSYGSGDQMIRNNLEAFFARYGQEDNLIYVAFTYDSLTQSRASTIFRHVAIPTEAVIKYGRCILQVPLTFDSINHRILNGKLVLVDQQRRIRGYYDPEELLEIDRLNTELDILLNNQHE